MGLALLAVTAEASGASGLLGGAGGGWEAWGEEAAGGVGVAAAGQDGGGGLFVGDFYDEAGHRDALDTLVGLDLAGLGFVVDEVVGVLLEGGGQAAVGDLDSL